MRNVILVAIFLLSIPPLNAQPTHHHVVFEGMSGYWTGLLEQRDSTGAESFTRVACDIRRSLDGANLIVHTFRYGERHISEQFETYALDPDSLLFRIAETDGHAARLRSYTVQGLQKVRRPGQWVIRLTERGAAMSRRRTNIRQNDSLIVLHETTADMIEWRVSAILRLARRPRPAAVGFTLPGYEQAQRVSVVGSFNGWKKGVTPMLRTRAGWSVTLPLPPGEYQYKFDVDGQLRRDPLSTSLISDGQGGYNAITLVP
jgi:hypothetical protein